MLGREPVSSRNPRRSPAPSPGVRADLDPPSPALASARLFPVAFTIGLSWAVALAIAFARAEPPAGTAPAGAFFSRLFMALLVGIGHGALLALAGVLVARLRPVRRHPRLFAIVVSLFLGTGYALGLLSIVKFRLVGSHLRYEDFWFLTRSLRQVGAETSGAERLFLAGVVLLPLALAGAILGLIRLGRSVSAEASPLRLAVLMVLAIAGASVAALAHPGARQAAVVYFPDTRGLAGWLLPSERPVAAPGTVIRGAAIAPYPSTPPPAPRNVLVLMLESIPWKRLYGPEARPESTPRLLELARESVVFDRAYATSTHSDYAQTSILASLHPRKSPGHDYFTRLDYPRTLFWDPLHALGYRTALFSCQNESWGNMIAFNTTPGLDLFRHSPDWPDAPRRGEGAESKVYEPAPVAAFFEWLDREPRRPFAVYLNFQATHYPYMVPDGFAAPYQPSALDFATTFLSYPLDKIPVMENRFHNALAYVDLHVGKVLDGLAARGLLETTAILVVSDHGEAFYEHGLPTHGTQLLEEQVRTAMLARLPGVAPRHLAEPVSVLDGVPLLYRALGLARHGNFQGRDDVLDPGYSGAGRSMLFTIQGMTREDGVLWGNWKYIVNWDRRVRALFDLASDPGERGSLDAARPEDAARLDAELRRLLELQLSYYQARGWEAGYYPPPHP